MGCLLAEGGSEGKMLPFSCVASARILIFFFQLLIPTHQALCLKMKGRGSDWEAEGE